jgi:hypothetical protein
VTSGSGEYNINSLFNGAVPSLTYGDSFAARGMSQECKADWNRFRRLPVRVTPIRAARATLEAAARTAGLSPNKLNRLLATFVKNQDGLPNQRYATVIDFDKAATQERMFVVDLQDGVIRKYKVAHGEGSGGIGAIPTRFSNKHRSHQSSLGCAVATFDKSEGRNPSPLRDSKGRHKLMFHGFDNSDSKHSNDQMCNRSIFMHPAQTPRSSNYLAGGGRSHGCPAVEPHKREEVYNQIGNGGLVCSYRDGETSSTVEPVVKKKRKARAAPRRRRR